MTVTVETPEGLKVGSAVREISASSRSEMLAEGNNAHIGLSKGEAVVVDLGNRGVLFALLSDPLGDMDYSSRVPFFAFPSPCLGGGYSACGIRYYSSLSNTETVVLDRRYYPKFVRFENNSDPRSIQLLLDMAQCANPKTGIARDSLCIERDRFEEFFGKGVKLRSVTVEMTKDIVEARVEKFLPPYSQSAEFRSWIQSLRYGDPRAISRDSFIKKN